MYLVKTFTYEIKKSKFIGYYYKIDNIDEVKIILRQLKKEHKKARHLPWACKMDNIIKKSDDKEPSNTAGTPIYNLIETNNLNNILIVIVRYFGGIKLGTGGLYRAYLNTAKELIKENL